MNICLIGNNLSNLVLAKNLLDREIKIDLYYKPTIEKSKLFFDIPKVLLINFFFDWLSPYIDTLIFRLAKVVANNKADIPLPIKHIFIIKI